MTKRTQFAKNVPEKETKHIAHARQLEREAEKAREAGDLGRAETLRDRANLCWGLVPDERRLDARFAFVRPILSGPRGEAALDD